MTKLNLLCLIVVFATLLNSSLGEHALGVENAAHAFLKPFGGYYVRRKRDKVSDINPLLAGKQTDVVKNRHEGLHPLSDLKQTCSSTQDCTKFKFAICEDQICRCTKINPVFVQEQKSCMKGIRVNETCEYTAQCIYNDKNSRCEVSGNTEKKCLCAKDYYVSKFPEVGYNCVRKSTVSGGTHVDPAMIGVLVGLGLMFVIICVVLRLFSKARFRENRSIFNTPNPRLMNASLFKDSKLLSPAKRGRKGSSARDPSRAPSINSVNKDTPRKATNGSLIQERRGSTLSNISATGSAAGATAGTRTHAMSAYNAGEKQSLRGETTVAIEAVD